MQTNEYTAAFGNYIRRGRKHLSESEQRALQVGTDSEGGYAVTDRTLDAIATKRDDQNIMRRLATVMPSSRDLKIPREDSHGSAAWIAEEGSYSESDDALGQVAMGAHKAGRIVKVSRELLQDGEVDIEAWVGNRLGRSIGIAEEAACINGDGSGKPSGIVGASQLGVSAAGAAAITADEVMNLYFSLASVYRRNAAWLMADATAKLVRKLTDSSGRYLWDFDGLLGRPVEISDNMPAATTGNKSIVFADVSEYVIVERSQPVVQRLDELYEGTGQVGFLGHQRVDGKLIHADAAKHLIQA